MDISTHDVQSASAGIDELEVNRGGMQRRQCLARRYARLETQVWRLIICSAFLAPPIKAQTPAPQPSVKAVAAPPPTLADTAAVTWVTIHPQPGDTLGQLAQFIKAEIARAIARGMTPFLELGATWCGPCQALEASLHTSQMIDAFAGAYMIHLDVDDWDTYSDFTPLGIHATGIPWIAGIDSTGHVTSEDQDAKDAPSIKRFLSAHMWHSTPKKVPGSYP